MEKIRVFELARTLNTNSKRLMEKLAEIDVVVKNHMSFLEDNELDALYKHIGVRNAGRQAAQDKAAAATAAAPAVTPAPTPSDGDAKPDGASAGNRDAAGHSQAVSSGAGDDRAASLTGDSPSSAGSRRGVEGGRLPGRDDAARGAQPRLVGGPGAAAAAAAARATGGAGSAPGSAKGQAAASTRGTGRDARKDTKSAPRIIRTTEVNLDKKAREESRANQSAQQGQAAVGGGQRYGDRRPQGSSQDSFGRGGGVRRDRGGRGRDGRGRDRDPGYRSDLVRSSDNNSGLMAGFTRMSREKTIDQLIAEAKQAQKLKQRQEAEAIARGERDAAGSRASGGSPVSMAGGAQAGQLVSSVGGAPLLSGADASGVAGASVGAGASVRAGASGVAEASVGAGASIGTGASVGDGVGADVSAERSRENAFASPRHYEGAEAAAGVAEPPAASTADAGVAPRTVDAAVPATAAVSATEAAAGQVSQATSQAVAGGIPGSGVPGGSVSGLAAPPSAAASGGSAQASASEAGRVPAALGADQSSLAKKATSAQPVQPDPSKVVVVVSPSQKPLPQAPQPLPQRELPQMAPRAQIMPQTDAGRRGPVGQDGRRPYGDGRQGGGYRSDGRGSSRASFDGRPDGSGRQDGTWHADGMARPYTGARGSAPAGAGGAARPQDRTTYTARPAGGGYGGRPAGGGYGGGARPAGGYGGYGGGGRVGGAYGSGYGGQRPQGGGQGGYGGQRPQGGQGGYGGTRPGGGYGGGYGGARPQGGQGGYGGARPAGAGYSGARPGGGFAAAGRPRVGGAPRTDAHGKPEDAAAARGEQKREHLGKDSDRQIKKDNKRTDATRPSAAAQPKSRRFRPEVTVLGEKKGVHEILDDDFIINEFYSEPDEAKRGKKQRQRRGLRRDRYIPPRAVLTSVTIPGSLTVKELAEALKKTASEVIRRLMGMGMMAGLNDVVDFDTCALVAGEFGIGAEQEVVVSEEDILFDDSDAEEGDLENRPPVVVVMGHVDHGKTSLLDAIRKTHVTSGEAGGITQHIGAYSVNVNGRAITFLDTPGHEAFTSMRQRGAMVTDIAILVVSAVDGVMPQTVEAINHAKAANVTIIVAVNMIDRDGANPDRVKQELTEHGLVVEEWGGDVIAVPVSAKTGENIEQLLEMTLLASDVLELRASPNQQAKGTVIEAKLDKARGPVATLLVQRGTLNVGDSFITGSTVGRIRAMLNDRGQQIKSAGPSTPVEIIGLSEVPGAGEVFYVTKDERVARSLAEKRRQSRREEELKPASRVVTLDEFFKQSKEGKVKDLNLVIKADVQGSVEAVRQALERLGNEEARVSVIHGGVGAINESDVSLASVSNAIIVGFNVRPGGAAVAEAAELAGVDMRLYTVIYNAIEDIEAALRGMLAPTFREVVLGHVEIRQIFRASGVGTIGGCYVLDGKIQRGNSIRVIRDGVTVHEGKLASLKRFKDDAREVLTGFECGVSVERFNDIKEHDIIEPYMMEEVRP